MKPLTQFNTWRVPPPPFWSQIELVGGPDDDLSGCFLIPRKGTKLRIIATTGDGWDHISISTRNRCPVWEEMEWVAAKFFEPHETAMQLHVPAADHINEHPFCLHWWRPFAAEIPRPPFWMVGPKREEPA